jgi:integrase/recombinase XerD
MRRQPRNITSDVVLFDKEQGDSFDVVVHKEIANVTTRSAHTRSAYYGDWGKWRSFCLARGVDIKSPEDFHVTAWIEEMTKAKLAPKTRARRVASLCTIYKRLRRKGKVVLNPFSVDDGPEREPARAISPTPLAAPGLARKLLATCDVSPLGIRDHALLRVLWATGARRAALLAMTFERLSADPKSGGYQALLFEKRGKDNRVLIHGRAALALTAWLAILEQAKITKGPIWRSKRGPLESRGLAHMIDRRAKRAGITKKMSPHQFRVAFLTLNPASLDSKQDAAGHADPTTTRSYNRTLWRGREAFEKMPEIEEAEE